MKLVYSAELLSLKLPEVSAVCLAAEVVKSMEYRANSAGMSFGTLGGHLVLNGFIIMIW